MKTYLTLLFCAPLFLYVLGVVFLDAGNASEKPAVNTVAGGSFRPQTAIDRGETGIPSLVKTGARGWVVAPLRAPDSTYVNQPADITEEEQTP